jgi:hypothetical protein
MQGNFDVPRLYDFRCREADWHYMKKLPTSMMLWRHDDHGPRLDHVSVARQLELMCVEFAHEDGAVSGTAVDGQEASMLSLKFLLSMACINLLVCNPWAA